MSEYTTLVIDTPATGVARVTMARGDTLNAFDETMIGELHRAFETLNADDSVRIVVLAGSGKHFSAGADVKWMQRAGAASEEWNVEDAKRFVAMLNRIHTSAKPTVARIQGAAMGGGIGLVCACDIVIAADNAIFSVSEGRFGLLPSVISPYLINAVGKRQALRLALSACRIVATEACAIGLAHKVVPAAELDGAIAAVVKDLLACGPQAQRAVKRLYSQLEVGPVTPEVQDLTARTIARTRGTREAQAGFAAFLNKEPAPWIRT